MLNGLCATVKTRIQAIFLLLVITFSYSAGACQCSLPVFGAYETATLHSIEQLQVETLVDSGATTTALDAKNIKMHINRFGQRWVYYDFIHRPTGKTVAMHQPVSRVVRIITHSGPPKARAVIKGTISVGGIERTVEMSLINRSNFPQQLLIGRNYLKNTALIDSGGRNLQKGR